MNMLTRKILSIALALAMLASMVTIPAFAENAKLWTETVTADGWIMVTNEGGATLGYSPKSGLKLVEADGFAFKDLNKNGQLDVYEDWRVDYHTRAQALVDSGELSTEWMMGLKMNPFRIGVASDKELDENTKIALNLGYRHLRYPKTVANVTVAWNNMIQEYIETLDTVVIPSTFLDDPLGGNTVSTWPNYLGVAATFDPEIAAQYGRLLSEEWRALGISMKVAPQIDLATEPRWRRITGTFGEDPQLSVDMAAAMVNGWQSTYDDEGNDLGWGEDSVNTQVKHLMGEGAAEGGREAHSLDGAFNVYPGGQFFTHLLPFLACLNLPGKTGATGAAMTNFSVAVDEFGDSIGGERVATSFNSWKLNELWRNLNNWDGFILSDFNVHVGAQPDANGQAGKCYGVEDMTVAERLLKELTAGVDAFGAMGTAYQADIDTAMEAYKIGVETLGQAEMDKIMADSTRRALKVLFNVGVVDNPYLTTEKALTVADSDENNAAGAAAIQKSVVMVKNTDNVIRAAGGEKPTVYIPWKFTPETAGWGRSTPASVAPCVNLTEALKYFNVVTDKAGTPSGDNGTFTPNDIVRATAEEIAACDFALVRISSPNSTNTTTGYDAETMLTPADYEYKPISLQYRPYTADSMFVRFESIGGLITEKEVQGTYGIEIVYEKENRSYYGKSTTTSNESDLDLVLFAASAADKVVVLIDASKPMIFSEFESEVDAILMGWGNVTTDAAFFNIVAGNVEPSGLLPLQMPANMETVEAQFEDVPRDMECHVDANGNAYDFTFGLNWSGVIDDARVAKYNVEPIVGEDPFQ